MRFRSSSRLRRRRLALRGFTVLLLGVAFRLFEEGLLTVGAAEVVDLSPVLGEELGALGVYRAATDRIFDQLSHELPPSAAPREAGVLEFEPEQKLFEFAYS
jgi:hypothetical protein